MVLQKFYQQSHAYSGSSFGSVVLIFLQDRSSGDVEVYPFVVADKFLQKQPGGDGAAPAPAGIFDVGDIALD